MGHAVGGGSFNYSKDLGFPDLSWLRCVYRCCRIAIAAIVCATLQVSSKHETVLKYCFHLALRLLGWEL
jgi:hypothetical protein